MGDRELEKKAWEIEQGRLVAEEKNKAEGTDFEPRPSNREPADVVLVSPSGKFQSCDAQVVSIPIDFRFRDDKHTVKRIQEGLSELLKARGIKQILLGLVLSGEAELRGMRPDAIEELGELIVQEGQGKNVILRYQEIYDRSPRLAELVHHIFISYHPDVIDEVSVDIPAGSAVPRDGRWIEEGIAKKVAKYGGENAVKDLILIVGVAGFVDDEQVNAFQRSFADAHLPFAEIWLNTPFHGTVCLKRRA